MSQSFFDLIGSLNTEILPETHVKKYQFLLRKQVSIKLALELNDSNGCLEGMNNKIKGIKLVAYGFRNFNNFKKRIVLMSKTLSV